MSLTEDELADRCDTAICFDDLDTVEQYLKTGKVSRMACTVFTRAMRLYRPRYKENKKHG